MVILARLAAVAIFLTASSAEAFLILSPDDVCAPTDDPCILDRPAEANAAFPLDFGLRTLRVTGAGSLSGSADISCGAFESNVPGRLMTLEEALLSPHVSLRIVARKKCSRDEAVPCLEDGDCQEAGAGTCSKGDGGIRTFGDIVGPPVGVDLRAAGDISLAGRIKVPAVRIGAPSGWVYVRSSKGSIDVYGAINASGGNKPPLDHYYSEAGSIDLLAAQDLRLYGNLRVNRGWGWVELRAGGDVLIQSSIVGRGNRFVFMGGAHLELEAGGDVRIERNLDGRRARIDLRGETAVYEGEPGGDCTIDAGGDIVVGEGTLLRSDSGLSFDPYFEDLPNAGHWWLESGGDLRFDGKLKARARGQYGEAAWTRLYADGSIELGPSAKIDLRAPYGAVLEIKAGESERIRIDGDLDLYAPPPARLFFPDVVGQGGDFLVEGGDVEIYGRMRTGGDESSGLVEIYSCRLHLGPTGAIDASEGEQIDGSWGIHLDAPSRIVAEAGSRILAKPDNAPSMYYADPLIPPLLLGTVFPAPELVESRPSSGCPVCGNAEVEAGETCDDGNREPGDGCNERCETEDR